ncbi:hypothetical protein PO909_005213, partial [Leuciscus waleckii]
LVDPKKSVCTTGTPNIWTTDPGPGSIFNCVRWFRFRFQYIWTLSLFTCMKSCFVFTKVTGMSSKNLRGKTPWD